MLNILENHLEKLGLSEKEAKIYLCLTELGKATPNAISRKIGIPRTTVYSISESLAEKGLVSVVSARNTTFFTINGGSSFTRLIDRQEQELSKRKQSAAEVMRLVEEHQNGNGNGNGHHKSTVKAVPKLQFYRGQSNVESMLIDNIPLWQQSYEHAGDYTVWGYQDHSFVKQYTKYLEHRWSTQLENEHIKLFTNESQIEKKIEKKIPNREVKTLLSTMSFSSCVWVCGNFVIMIQPNEEPHYAYQLEDAALSANLRTIFQALWNLAK